MLLVEECLWKGKLLAVHWNQAFLRRGAKANAVMSHLLPLSCVSTCVCYLTCRAVSAAAQWRQR